MRHGLFDKQFAAVVSIIALLAGLLSSSGLRPLAASPGTPVPAPIVASATPRPGRLITVYVEVDRAIEYAPSCGDLLVVDATVSQLLPGRWNTSDGLAPIDTVVPGDFIGPAAIYTPLQLASMNILLDHRTTPTQTFSMAGGTVNLRSQNGVADGLKLIVEGYPHVKANHRYVLVFAPGTDPQAPPPYYQTQQRLMLVQVWPADAQGNVILWAKKQLASCHT